MCEQLQRRGGHWALEECLAFCSSVSEDQEVNLTRLNISGDDTTIWACISMSIQMGLEIAIQFMNLTGQYGFTGIIPKSSCPLVVIILQMCQRKMCKYDSDYRTFTWHLLILKKSICTIFQYDYHGYARTISWKQTFLFCVNLFNKTVLSVVSEENSRG